MCIRDRVGLCARDYLNRDVDTSLSGGEVKRIEIATLLAKNSRLMIFDEPEAEIVLIANGEIAGRGTADELYPKLLSQTVAGCNLLEVNGIC